MGFFKKSVPSQSKRTALTIIAEGNKISGDMAVTGKLHIDGIVEGNITSIENVSIGKTGMISGTIKAKNINVTGLLEGEVICDHLHIETSGRVVATVISIGLTMDHNSQFIGERRESNVSKVDARKQNKMIKTPDVIDNLPDKITLASLNKDKSDAEVNGTNTETFLDDLDMGASHSVKSSAPAPVDEGRGDEGVEIKSADKKAKVQDSPHHERQKLSAVKSKSKTDSQVRSKPKVANEKTTMVELKV